MVDIQAVAILFQSHFYAIGFPLQIFSGALTEIRCSATTPNFLLNERYGAREYDQLPGLFGIEVEVVRSINGSNPTVMLHVNGTSHSNNVTVMCRNPVSYTHLTLPTIYSV